MSEPATPLPWSFVYTTTAKGLQLPLAIESENKTVAFACNVYDNGSLNYIDIRDEDAAYIVEACNGYTELRKEIDQLQDTYGSMGEVWERLAQLASTQAELEKARSVLRRLEFDCEDGSGWCCPICDAFLRLHSSKPRRLQHNPDCELANALNRGETE